MLRLANQLVPWPRIQMVSSVRGSLQQIQNVYPEHVRWRLLRTAMLTVILGFQAVIKIQQLPAVF